MNKAQPILLGVLKANRRSPPPPTETPQNIRYLRLQNPEEMLIAASNFKEMIY